MRIAFMALAAGCGVTAIDVKTPAPPLSTAPPFTLATHQGSFNLGDTLARGDLVLVFYRGAW